MNMSIRKFLAEEDGVTALEYGVLAAILAIVIIAVFGTTAGGGWGTVMTKLLNKVSDAVTAA